MFKKYQIILVALILSLALVFVGCGNKDNQDTPPVLSATEIELSVGESKQLTVNDYEGLVEWGTDDFKTISVADDGTVSGIAVGQATITAYLEDGTELTCKVVCKIAYVSVPKLVLDGEIEQDNKYTISLRLDGMHDEYELTPILKLDGEAVSGVTFTLTSADTDKVAVDSLTIKAKAETNGTTVTVSCEYQGKTYSTTVSVVVKGV